MNETNWIPGLVMLGAGVVGAVLFLLSVRSRSGGLAPSSGDDLDARYQARLAQLKDHLAQKHLYPAEKWEARRAALEADAAAALKDRDQARHEALKAQARAEKREAAQQAQTGAAPAPGASPAAAPAPSRGFFAQNPALGGALIGAAVVGFFVFLGVSVSESAKPRQDGMTMTGAVPPGGGPGPMAQAPAHDDKLVAMARRVESSPDDPEAVSDLAMYLMRRQAFQEARGLVQRVTALDPFNVKGRVGRALYRALEGQATALGELERLAATYPEAYDARMFAGLLAMDQNDPGRALKNLEAYVASAPGTEQPPMMRMMIQQIRSQMGTAP